MEGVGFGVCQNYFPGYEISKRSSTKFLESEGGRTDADYNAANTMVI
jgi:hypothetical protein